VLLRFEPCLPCRKIWLAPALPSEWGEIRLDKLQFAGRRVSIRARQEELEVSGLPPDLQLIRARRFPQILEEF
jgi:hypothetical protein